MKTDPSLDLIEDIRDTDRGREFFRDTRTDAERDDGDRDGWLNKQDHYWSRRVCMEDRDPQYPWPGSSSIVMPLIDKTIDEMKPAYVNLVTAAKPPCTVLAADPDSQGNVHNVELFESWLVHFGSPGFVDNVILATDDLLQTGRGILKTYWNYHTVRCAQMLDRNRLPERLRKLVITKGGDADLLHLLTGGPAAGGPPIINLGEFNAILPQIREVLKQDLGLDWKDPDDQEAVTEVIRWFKAGGRNPIRVDSTQVRGNVPAVSAVHPKDLVLPANARSNLEEAPRYTEIMRFSRFQIEERARTGAWNQEAVKKILEGGIRRGGNKARSAMLSESDEAYREGVNPTSDEVFEVYATHSWYSRRDRGVARKVVLLWSDRSPDIPLRFYEYVRPSGEWPHKTAVFELNKDRWYAARGIPEKLDDIDWEVTRQHRYKLNRADIATAPTIAFDPNALMAPGETWHHIPGQMMPVRNPNASLRVMEYSQLDVVFEREEQNLLTWAQRYMGSANLGSAGTNFSRLTEPITATEAAGVIDQARQALSLRGVLFQKGMMQPVYREMLDLFIAHGDDSIYVRVTDSDPIKLSKENLRGQFVLQCTGTIGTQDPETEEQRALNRIIVLSKIAPMIGQKYEVDLSEAVRDWLEKSDIRLSKLIMRKRTPQEIQAVLQQQAQVMAQQQALQQQAAQPPVPPVLPPGKHPASPPPPPAGPPTFAFPGETGGLGAAVYRAGK